MDRNADNYVDLSKLEKDSRGRVDWNKSIGRKVLFSYNGIEGEFCIIGRDKNQTILTNYKGYLGKARSDSILKCNLQYILGIKNNDFKLKKNEIVHTITGEIRIIKGVRVKRRKYYEYQCEVCGYKDRKAEYHLINGHGCPVCTNKICVTGINDFGHLYREIADYYEDKEYVNSHVLWTKKSSIAKCPICGFRKSILPGTIYSQGFGCNKCSDGLSFPQKFVLSFLDQAGISFKTEWSPGWSQGKRYDFYLDKLHYIVEVNGKQHREGGFERAGGNDAIAEQKNDLLKYSLATSNKDDVFSAEEYIVIDGSVSMTNFMKERIMESALWKIVDNKLISWEECAKYASNSLVFTACKMWEKRDEVTSTQDIADILHVHRSTVIRMLNLGTENGWCSYDGDYEAKKTLRKNSELKKKKVFQFDEHGKLVACYDSVIEAASAVGGTGSCISSCISGNLLTYKNYYWSGEKTICIRKPKDKRKGVIQYDLNGKYIKEFSSIEQAAHECNILGSSISYCARSKVKRTAGGFLWRYKDGPQSYEPSIKPNIKEVYQFSLEGELLNIYESVACAAKETGLHAANIASAARGCVRTCGGYLWRYKGGLLEDIPAKKNSGKKVKQYDIEGNFIREYQTLTEAAENLGTTSSNISYAARGKGRIAKGYIWRYSA